MTRIRNLALSLGAAFALSYAGLRAIEIKLVVGGYVLPITALWGAVVAAVLVGVVGLVAWRLRAAREKKERVKVLFGASLSPALVEHMAKSGATPQLGGHELEITAFFSAVQSFHGVSESLPPARLVEWMTEYLTSCTEIVQAEGGLLDKYIGDAVIAMFGAPISQPDHAYRACVATHRIQIRLEELRAKWRGEGAKWPAALGEMRSAIGLNTGQCLVGNFGSHLRFHYSMMGHHVNLAARMESGAKSWGVYSMCTEATRAACVLHGGDRVVFRPLGRITVKGLTAPVPLHEIIGLKESIASSARECAGLFEQGLNRYYERDWQGAQELFQQSARLEPLIPDRAPGVKINPSLVYLGICQHHQQQPPPENWNGVVTATAR